ncbi:10443_t:CDS:2 [Paraglomus occultum]|uniref:10443_t:CDS:1 n=1 Tax=Paraglomus occultum TaxID=144539 RepID=A0A9N9FQL6_9GLOM|nr:10443_t:CDS:2 [Paraglomus occultum]
MTHHYRNQRICFGVLFSSFILAGLVCLVLLAIVHPPLAEGVVKNSSYSISKLSITPDSATSASISMTGEFDAGRDGDVTFTKAVVFSVDQVDIGSVELDPISVTNDKGTIDDQDKTLAITNSTALGVLVHKILTDKEVEVTGTGIVTVRAIGINRDGISIESPFKFNANSPTTISLAGNLASGAAADDFKAKLAGGGASATLTTTSAAVTGKEDGWVKAGFTGVNVTVTISAK